MNHDDLLNADLPNTEERRLEMLDAVKTRAKGSFQTKDMRSAEKLYGKAITISERRIVSDGNPDGLRYEKDLHLLYSNRAAVRLLLGKWQSALADCESSLDIDVGFIKSHFRKGQALIGLKRFDDAIKSCDQSLELFNENKELLDLKVQATEKKKKEEEEKEKLEKEKKSQLPAENAPKDPYRPVRPANENSNTNSSSSTANGNSGGGDKGNNDDNDGNSEDNNNGSNNSPSKNDGDSGTNGGSSFRGYKKTKDGKTTSYFHTELTDEAKKLIGDCKPKQIDPALLESQNKKVAGSAWNQAGTFEEKNVTSWFADTLKSEVKGSLLVGKNSDVKIKYNVSDTSGDASITHARGKTKCVHDFSCTLRWKFHSIGVASEDASDTDLVKGTINLESDGDGDWDTVVTIDDDKKPRNAEDRDLVQNWVKSSGKGLQPEVIRRLKKCEELFREKAKS